MLRAKRVSKSVLVNILVLFLVPIPAHSGEAQAGLFPLPTDSYQDEQLTSIPDKLLNRIRKEPLNLIATIIFVCAIIHTFSTSRFLGISHRYQERFEGLQALTEQNPHSARSYERTRDRL
ncbi:MAG: hypothetical protein JO076_00610, partial [Verrucomicrobia bacterium]|nr:hypothetical protein [Verrucomicrobiota bacterium]